MEKAGSRRGGASTAALAMALAVLLSLAWQASAQASGLKVGFYNGKCARKFSVEAIVGSVVAAAQKADPTICAALIRLHFHDCFVQGCEGSLLLDFADPNLSEKSSPPNANSVRGFDVIDKAKARVEKTCPGVVSCTDIAALAARDCVRLLRGVTYKVPTGRRDGTTSGGFLGPLQQLPAPFHDIATIIGIFANNGLDKKDVVFLSGLHTVGRARCVTFSNRLFDAAGNPIQDPFLTPARSAQLQKLCPFGGDGNVHVDMDATPKVVDTVYFKGVVGNTSIFQSDHNMLNDPDTAKQTVALANQTFPGVPGIGASMIKMGNNKVLTGTAGQIRTVCNAVNAA